jgi:hypothetical protein
MITLTLTQAEAALLVTALDSHVYWQLSDPAYRSSGYVYDPGADDEEAAAEIAEAEALARRIEASARSGHEPGVGGDERAHPAIVDT